MLEASLNIYDESIKDFSDLDHSLFQQVMDSITRDDEGRLIAPALWDPDVEHLLAKNFNLAHNILKSTLHKLQKKQDTLYQYDDVIKEQLHEGIICEIEDIDSFLRENPDASFMPHSGVVRENSLTTKLRVVFLSNLAEKVGGCMSHNAISHPGPNLNYPLMYSLFMLRFSKFLLTFDLRKAFLQIKLREKDSRKLLFLWCRDVRNGDFTPVCYKFLRLGFGLRFSPSILLSCLWYILMRDNPSDSEELRRVKETFYALTYMDNISYTSSDSKDIEFAYLNSFKIFNDYKFDLQKFYTNSSDLQTRIDATLKEDSPQMVELLGLKWDRIDDTFVCKIRPLDEEANTKRKILSSVNSVFDICGVLLPVMNRAKFFLHKLQVRQDLGWDDVLGHELVKEWQCICRQLNQCAEFRIPRSFGDRGNEYHLIGCADASKEALGCSFYMWNVNSNSCKFLSGKSRIVGKELSNKSIPVLELVALTWATELCMRYFKIFRSAIQSIDVSEVIVYSDSSIALCWVKAKSARIGKVERRSVLVNNKLNKILAEAKTHPIKLRHLAGKQNPADAVTRPISPALLRKSNYHSGPSLQDLEDDCEEIVVSFSKEADSPSVSYAQTLAIPVLPVIDFERYSSLSKITRILNFVFKFIKACRNKVYERDPAKYSDLNINMNTYVLAQKYLIKTSQHLSFPGVLDFFRGNRAKCEPLVTQLNLFLDEDGIIKASSKLRKLESETLSKTPILLSRSCYLTKLIVRDLHLRMRCAQMFKLLASLRNEFYIPKAYTLIKNMIKNCMICRLMHGRGLAIKVNDYPDFRINPGKRPFTTVMIDTIGPYKINTGNIELKQYVLILTCMFTRAINLIVCESLNAADFLRALQLHILDYGIMECVVSDNQPGFIAGFECLSRVLESVEVQDFLKTRGIKPFSFKPYPSGASFLGGAVESLVKQVKNVLYVSMSKNRLTAGQFIFLVAEAKALVNKRPIGFKKSLTNDNQALEVPFTLTPEILLKGYEVPSFNILSLGEENHVNDPTWVPGNTSRKDLFDYFDYLNAQRGKLQECYEMEFLDNLKWQATNSPDRYKQRTLTKLCVGDMVAIKSKMMKPFYYSRGIVTNIEYNDKGNINAVAIRKSNGESVRRHPSDLVLLYSVEGVDKFEENENDLADEPINASRPQREAKTNCMLANKKLAEESAV